MQSKKIGHLNPLHFLFYWTHMISKFRITAILPIDIGWFIALYLSISHHNFLSGGALVKGQCFDHQP
jgi:hypothetical protein